MYTQKYILCAFSPLNFIVRLLNSTLKYLCSKQRSLHNDGSYLIILLFIARGCFLMRVICCNHEKNNSKDSICLKVTVLYRKENASSQFLFKHYYMIIEVYINIAHVPSQTFLCTFM